ncbi:hypothetical protein BCR33DRAFT_787123 [Rhizoclosmatium globosum]|uniref:Uncharacterized protein n=1 Tax=Rhizoclosmatium globosum TaxID=329046 RepID=A0A1Y2C2Y2_9FUNG|nr:hypothetical protein BCR33DRAFT_787123 [Rhizoclosmatium globosum]|eukprot:ORY41402.1 hypothetical protein BCR33DRAFT_787123 [Rhizoclosmatium globosum]
MADAFMDLASSVVLVFATVSAADKNPQHYPAGKQRFETAAIVVFSCIMGSLSVELIIEGAKALMEGEHETDINATNLSCIAFAVGVKSLLYIYCYALRQYPTAMILAQDHRNDVILNVTGVVLSLVGQYSIWYADPLEEFSLRSGFYSTGERLHSFIGQAASRVFLNRITFIAMTHDVDIQLVDTVRAYSSGAGYFVEVDIVMDPNTPLHKAHDIAESLQNKIERLDDVERAFVHIDYEATHTPEHSY